jgi:hypothetical protein
VNHIAEWTETADSSGGVEIIDVHWNGHPLPSPVTVLLAHPCRPLWCGAGGAWLASMERALRFTSNVDAIIYCQALRMDAVVVGMDRRHREIYRLNIDRVLDLVCEDAEVRAAFRREPGLGGF